jgi:hypothetical protein
VGVRRKKGNAVAKHNILITVDDDMSEASLKELANAILMWKYVVSVEVESAQLKDDYFCECEQVTESMEIGDSPTPPVLRQAAERGNEYEISNFNRRKGC